MNVISCLYTEMSWPKCPQTETAGPKCPVAETAQTETDQTETAKTETARPNGPNQKVLFRLRNNIAFLWKGSELSIVFGWK